MNVTRAVLPMMRQQRSGLLLTISSTAGIAGQMFCTAYAAAKFGIEGWMESLAPEIAPLGIRTMLVEPGFFRTELLTDDSTTYAQPTIDDYAERTKEIVAARKSMDGKQGGDPAKLAEAHRELSAAPRTITPDCIEGQRTGRWMQKKRFWLRGACNERYLQLWVTVVPDPRTAEPTS